jgi:hypothetical protein
LSYTADKKGMGWLPDYPSFKDYTPQSKNIAPLFKKVDLGDTIKGKVLKTSTFKTRS